MSTSRIRNGIRSSGCRTERSLLLFTEDVPYASLGVDQRGGVRCERAVDLAAQVGDVGLHDRTVTAPVVGPHVIQDLCLGQHPAGVEHQVAQQGELGGGEVDLGAAAAY